MNDIYSTFDCLCPETHSVGIERTEKRAGYRSPCAAASVVASNTQIETPFVHRCTQIRLERLEQSLCIGTKCSFDLFIRECAMVFHPGVAQAIV